MKNLLDDVRETLLMGPGPSCVRGTVYRALARPTIGHLDPYFITIMDEIKKHLQELFHTRNSLTIPMSGTGSAGMETCFVNLVNRGDAVLILVNGVFGVRMVDVAERLGADVTRLDFEWGTPVDVEEAQRALAAKKYELVAVVHAETSTGVRNPVAEIGELVRQSGALYLVDTVTGLGGIEVKTDDWNIDAIYSGTQKCLSCPPGLAPVSLSSRAVDRLMNRRAKVPNWYLDLSMISNYWQGRKRAYHHTAPINMLYALSQALYDFHEEGAKNVIARHARVHRYLVDGLEAMGLKMLVDPDFRLPMLNAVLVPDGVDEAGVRARLLDECRIEIGAGLGALAGRIWRIGLMGHTAYEKNVDRLLAAFKDLLPAS